MPTADLEHVPVAITAEEIDAQLAKVLDSHHFRHSHRYPALLRYLVEQTQIGRGAQLKERLLGIEVFHRAPDYDTNTDPVVRVTAAEVRKRIAQYYQEPDHTGELRIDLPTGSYSPRFFRSPVEIIPVANLAAELPEPENGAEAGEAAMMEPTMPLALPESVSSAPKLRQPLRPWLTILASICCGAFLAWLALRSMAVVASWREHAERSFWAPLTVGDAPILVLIGHHTVGVQGNALRAAQGDAASPSEAVLQLMNEREQVPLSDVSSLARLTDYMAGQHQSYRLAGAGDADIADLSKGPVLLFAGLDNRWTMRLTQHLRYQFADVSDDSVGVIEDTQTPGRMWRVDFKVPYKKMPMDYAIVARYFDPLLEQPVMIVAGVGATGTTSASEFVTSERMLDDLNKLAPGKAKHENVELVLAMPVIDGRSGAPHIVASQFW